MYDVIILGAGPAGLTAALYCGRSKLKTKIIEKSQAGGLVNITEEIENFPGIFKANSKSLIETMKRQVKELEGVELDEFNAVRRMGYKKDIITLDVWSDIGETQSQYKCRALIIATGTHPKELGIPGEKNFRAKGVSYCAVCDGPLFGDKDVVLIGGGDTAIEEALYLTKFARRVKVVHRRERLRATGILQERLKSNPKIELILSSVALKILGRKSVEKLRIKNVRTNKESEVDCSGVFIFVGYSPNTDFVKDFVDLDADGFIITDEQMKTKTKGIFACGDCRKRPFRQIITACGEGAIAAHTAEKFITEEKS